MIGYAITGGKIYWRAKTKRRLKTTAITLAVLVVCSSVLFVVLKKTTEYSLEQAQSHLRKAYLCQKYYPKEFIIEYCLPEVEKAAWWAKYAPIPFILDNGYKIFKVQA